MPEPPRNPPKPNCQILLSHGTVSGTARHSSRQVADGAACGSRRLLLRRLAKLDAEPLLPVPVGELGSDQEVTPVDRGQIEHLAQAGDVTAGRQDNGGLDSFARENVLAVSGF